jgi:hypothetical protein
LKKKPKVLKDKNGRSFLKELVNPADVTELQEINMEFLHLLEEWQKETDDHPPLK